MNKKGLMSIFLITLLVFSTGSVSADAFTDFLKKFFQPPRLSPTCVDSDNGVNLIVKGFVTYNNQTYYDNCDEGPNEVTEWHCLNGNANSGIYPCPSGYICSGGACAASGGGGGGGGGPRVD